MSPSVQCLNLFSNCNETCRVVASLVKRSGEIDSAGIMYKCRTMRTVPLSRLEQDLALGTETWRASKIIRNRMSEMKLILYYAMAQASAKGVTPVHFLIDFQAELQAGKVSGKHLLL